METSLIEHTPNGVCLDMSRTRRQGDLKVGIAYLRVSTDEQRLGPEAQRSAIEDWAAREDVQIAAWHLDQGVSGGAPIEERPALLAALAGVREHRAGLLLVAKRDRIARDVVIAAMVERAAAQSGARVVSAAGEANGTEPADQFMRTVLDGAAAYERALIRARTKAALAAKATRGERVGQIPWGWQLDADGLHLVPEPFEQRVIEFVCRRAAQGASQRTIAAELRGGGITNRNGGPLSQVQISRMLRRAAAERARN